MRKETKKSFMQITQGISSVIRTYRILFLFFTLFFLILVVFSLFDFFNFDEKIYFSLTSKHFYDVIFWENLNLGTIATLSAVFIALFSTIKTVDLVHEQLKIEQQPLVVVENNIDVGGIDSGPNSQGKKYLLIKFKNIGRGPALRITANLHRTNPDKSFFVTKESHSFELGTNTESAYRKIDEQILKQRMFPGGLPKTINKTDPLFMHIYFRDQLGNEYHVKAKFFWENDLLKLMENKILH